MSRVNRRCEVVGGQILGVGLEEAAPVAPASMRSAADLDDHAQMIPSSRPTFANTSSANCSSSRGVRGRDDRPHAGLVARDGREGDALREDALVEQPVRQLHRQRAVADDHRRDRALAEPVLNPSACSPALKKRVLSHSRSMICGSCSSTSMRRDARGGDRRRMRGREQERPRAVVAGTRSARGCRRRSRRARRSPSTACRPGCRRGRACRSDRPCRGRSGRTRRSHAHRPPS